MRSNTDGLLSLQLALERLPWLLVTLVAGMASAWIIGHFQTTLQRWVALAAYIPVLMGIGGNAGTQSLGVTVRALALRHLNRRTVRQAMVTEVAAGALLGLGCGAIVFLVVLYWQRDLHTAGVVGSATCAVLTAATGVGTLVPIVFHLLSVDPAIASGPFITTAVDIIGLLIYLGLATFALSSLG